MARIITLQEELKLLLFESLLFEYGVNSQLYDLLFFELVEARLIHTGQDNYCSSITFRADKFCFANHYSSSLQGQYLALRVTSNTILTNCFRKNMRASSLRSYSSSLQEQCPALRIIQLSQSPGNVYSWSLQKQYSALQFKPL